MPPIDRNELVARVLALPESGLATVENAVSRAEAAIPPEPGSSRVVAGATITERPDIAYAAEIAQEGMSRR